jgi:AAA15 family ATPase/GTPase
MIHSIEIKNFKAFSETEKIKMAPITLIYGPNSSGKSSIIHSIMLMKQSISTPSPIGGLVSNGLNVDLGDYSSMVHRHELDRDINLSFEYSINRTGISHQSESKVFGTKYKRKYDLTYSNSRAKDGVKEFTYLKNIKMHVGNSTNESLFNYELESNISNRTCKSIEDINKNSKIYRCPHKDTQKAIMHYLNRKTGSTKTDSFGDFFESLEFYRDSNFATPSMIHATIETKNLTPDSRKRNIFHVENMFFLNMTINELSNELKQKFNSISYLGPLRSHPSRFYAPKGDQNETVGKQGENVAKFLYEKSPEITDEINKWFKDFEIPYELSAEGIGNNVTGTVICLQLKDLRTNVIVGPSDVGFGIGQILPVIVEGLVRDNGIICVEQPEIHLHPRLQANLMDFFINTSLKNTTEKTKEKQSNANDKDKDKDKDEDRNIQKNQWIIETHSEALMLRLQRRIKEGKISPEDVSIIYVHPTSEGGKIMYIPLDSDGDFLSYWPDGFFEERINERFGG